MRPTLKLLPALLLIALQAQAQTPPPAPAPQAQAPQAQAPQAQTPPPAAGQAEARPAPVTRTYSKGKLIENVVSVSDPTQKYILYIPTGYDPARPGAVLYAFDARGRALIPAKLFRPAAEKYGWLLVSSYNSASDGPMEPNVKAMQAMWNDTHKQFKIDDKRTYATGFSGTTRSACTMGTLVPGSLAGVIGAGAGFSHEVPPKKDTPFAFYGAIGDLDFNYYELLELEETLSGLGLPHRIAFFSGPHQWMPEEYATAGVEWMELQAMKSGRRPKDQAFVDAQWGRETERARGLEAAGRALDAAELFQALARDYEGLRDVSEAAAKAKLLADSKLAKDQQKERKADIARSERYLREAQRAIAATDASPNSYSEMMATLQVAQLRARAKEADTPDGRSAQRLLNSVGTQVGFYLPQQAMDKKEYGRAAFYLSIATEIAPDNPFYWLNLAAAHAKAGQKKRALEEIKKAAETGLPNPNLLETEEAFQDLRGEAAYKEALEAARKTQEATRAAQG
jgi:predicted esterase